VLVATLGPGITNTTTAVAHAVLDRSAVVVLTSEIATSLKAVYTHQIIDQDRMTRPLMKWSTTIQAKGAFEQVRNVSSRASSSERLTLHCKQTVSH
jgi:acetolactate synthase I/II/III large subunit